ncbi:MAG: helix-turn-helix transcriptional regulator [Candidatus Eisenbacteria bacterium]|nr:helix-turn-helix transcriptional regulator [Candidatus Eisenbacteria bacterium]
MSEREVVHGSRTGGRTGRETTTPATDAADRGTPSPAPVADAPADPGGYSPAELGRRIKMLRIGRGMTLKDLEERGGISATHVSEIERGKASPTVGALGRIATALGLRPATLVEAQPLPVVCVHRASDADAYPLQWGGATIVPLADPTQDSELGLHRLTLPISRDVLLEHHHDGEEWVTVLAGVAEIRVEGRPYVLREGDSLHFRATHPHSYANLGSAPVTLLVASRPRLAL